MANARLALVLGLLSAFLAPAHAQPRDLPPVYFSATRGPGGQPVIKFIFSKRSSVPPRYEPTHAFRIAPDLGQRKCNTERTDDFRISDEYTKIPLYDSANPRRQVPVDQLPVFFATVVSAELARKGWAKTSADSLPYHTCTRLLWERLLGLRPDKK